MGLIDNNSVSAADRQAKADKKQLLQVLEDLGDKRTTDDDVTYEGTRFVIPQTMTAKRALEFLQHHVEQQEEVHSFIRTFNFRPWDGAAAVHRALRKVTGTTGLGKAQMSFFGSTPPRMITINTGPDTQVQVPWGQIEVPVFEGTMSLDSTSSEEFGQIFVVLFDAPRKYRFAIEGLFRVIQEELESASIYKGKAIDAARDPNYKDTRVIDPERIVYSEQAMADLDAQLWRVVENTSWARANGVPLKRAILLEGPYGTGKTEAANITAKKCVENGWTFIQVRANKDNLEDAMKTARLYQPAVVFFEDIDIAADAEQTSGTVSRLLDIFDGMDAKHNEIIAVLTTNHVEKIHKGMVRPGRLDGIVHIGALDQHGVEKLSKIRLGEERLTEVDWDAVYKAMEGYMPAFVNEALTRVKLYARSVEAFTTRDLVRAAEGLRAQFNLMENASEGKGRPTMDGAMRSLVQDALDKAKILDYDGDDVGSMGLQVNVEEEV
jgi:transitional endoplasmic reticulum ATPase